MFEYPNALGGASLPQFDGPIACRHLCDDLPVSKPVELLMNA